MGRRGMCHMSKDEERKDKAEERACGAVRPEIKRQSQAMSPPWPRESPGGTFHSRWREFSPVVFPVVSPVVSPAPPGRLFFFTLFFFGDSRGKLDRAVGMGRWVWHLHLHSRART